MFLFVNGTETWNSRAFCCINSKLKSKTETPIDKRKWEKIPVFSNQKPDFGLTQTKSQLPIYRPNAGSFRAPFMRHVNIEILNDNIYCINAIDIEIDSTWTIKVS